MGKGAPASDPMIGQAAMLAAQTGEDHLAFMRNQAEITNGWASEDRARYTDVYRPIEDSFIEDSVNYDTAARRETEINTAQAGVRTQAGLARKQQSRRDAAMGLKPGSGRSKASSQRTSMDEGLAVAGAGNIARQKVEETGHARRAGIVNMGRGMAVNPAQSMGLSNNAANAGASAAMQGYNTQGNLLNQDYQNRMQSWQANQSGLAGMMGGIGSIIGALPMASSKELKENKRPEGKALESLMKMPVERWKYKKGVSDEGEHVGPYAEDFKAATGLGDGRSISPIDLMGVTAGAIQDLAAKVDKLEKVAA